jgi:hypothetical protein
MPPRRNSPVVPLRPTARGGQSVARGRRHVQPWTTKAQHAAAPFTPAPRLPPAPTHRAGRCITSDARHRQAQSTTAAMAPALCCPASAMEAGSALPPKCSPRPCVKSAPASPLHELRPPDAAPTGSGDCPGGAVGASPGAATPGAKLSGPRLARAAGNQAAQVLTTAGATQQEVNQSHTLPSIHFDCVIIPQGKHFAKRENCDPVRRDSKAFEGTSHRKVEIKRMSVLQDPRVDCCATATSEHSCRHGCGKHLGGADRPSPSSHCTHMQRLRQHRIH